MRCRQIRRVGGAVLVEWDDGRIHRAYIPAEAFPGEGEAEVDDDVLAAGIEYGADWEARLSRVTPAELADRLRRAGFWTVEDVRANANMACAILRLGTPILGDLLRE